MPSPAPRTPSGSRRPPANAQSTAATNALLACSPAQGSPLPPIAAGPVLSCPEQRHARSHTAALSTRRPASPSCAASSQQFSNATRPDVTATRWRRMNDELAKYTPFTFARPPGGTAKPVVAVVHGSVTGTGATTWTVAPGWAAIVIALSHVNDS